MARAVLRDDSGRGFDARVVLAVADMEFVIGKEKGGERRLIRLANFRVTHVRRASARRARDMRGSTDERCTWDAAGAARQPKQRVLR